jgi:hypothetical protein
MENEVWLEIHTRTHEDLEWFKLPECNTLRPLFCIAPLRVWSTELKEVRWCMRVLPEEGLG